MHSASRLVFLRFLAAVSRLVSDTTVLYRNESYLLSIATKLFCSHRRPVGTVVFIIRIRVTVIIVVN